MYKKKFIVLACLLGSASYAVAQKSAPVNTANETAVSTNFGGIVTTSNTVTIGSQKVAYTAQAGYLDLKNDTGKTIAKIFFTYYKKQGEEASNRPICFTFNGGPGSSSVWLHIGALGPKRVVLQKDGTATPPPYQLVNNEFSWLDKTDLVFIDPVTTGFSRPAPGESAKQFHGYNEDIQATANFIRSFTTKYERWASPKFLAGESYGTTRAAGLSKYLTDSYRMYINGVFLISPVLNFGTNDYYVGNDLPRALYIPSYTAAAWYHKKLSPQQQQKSLKALLAESEKWALEVYAPALIKGDWLTAADKDKIASEMSNYTGLDKEYILQANLRVEESRFYKELRRKDGLAIGRLDARFTSTNLDAAGEFVDFDPSFTNIDGPFTSAVNDYFQRELNFKEEKPYNILASVYPWNYNNVQNQFLNVAESLRDAMTKNPHLKVYVGMGYYDFATPYFTAMYDVEHMFLQPWQRKNVQQYYYNSGHMYYINEPDAIQFKKDVDAFFASALAK
ncbi:MAG: peptidase S10 [Bacteroidetes bacterium]|nr:MAG: peptidase S10 [Bacteroidota bacterium]TAF91527.1 MAG: peptidase S10 [Bacteroidota bacterium]